MFIDTKKNLTIFITGSDGDVKLFPVSRITTPWHAKNRFLDFEKE